MGGLLSPRRDMRGVGGWGWGVGGDMMSGCSGDAEGADVVLSPQPRAGMVLAGWVGSAGYEGGGYILPERQSG